MHSTVTLLNLIMTSDIALLDNSKKKYEFAITLHLLHECICVSEEIKLADVNEEEQTKDYKG